MVLEDQDVFESPVLLQIENSVAKSPQHILDALGWECRQCCVVIRRLDDDLVSADAIHLVKHAFGLAVQVAFNSEGRKLIGHNAHRPSRCMPLWRGPPIRIWAVGLNFRWCLAFVTVAEGAKPTLVLDAFTEKIGRSLSTIG